MRSLRRNYTSAGAAAGAENMTPNGGEGCEAAGEEDDPPSMRFRRSFSWRYHLARGVAQYLPRGKLLIPIPRAGLGAARETEGRAQDQGVRVRQTAVFAGDEGSLHFFVELRI